jgi:hypothetical protein
MRRALLAFWLLIAPIDGLTQGAASSPPAVTTSGPVGRPDVRVGDRWKYRITDTYTKLTEFVSIEVTSVTEGRIHTRSSRSALDAPTSSAAGSLVEIWDRDWNQIRAGDIEFTPFYPALKFPLEPGTQWSGIVQWYGGSGILKHQLTAQAAAWERVVVPAGSFDAIRIVVHGSISETGTLNYYAQSGTLSGTIWYAPLVGRIVRKEFVHRDNSPTALGNLAERWDLLEYKGHQKPL